MGLGKTVDADGDGPHAGLPELPCDSRRYERAVGRHPPGKAHLMCGAHDLKEIPAHERFTSGDRNPGFCVSKMIAHIRKNFQILCRRHTDFRITLAAAAAVKTAFIAA